MLKLQWGNSWDEEFNHGTEFDKMMILDKGGVVIAGPFLLIVLLINRLPNCSSGIG